MKEKHTEHYLRAWRKLRGLTQERLAGRLDVSFGLISQWETGETKLTEDKIRAIERALHMEPGDIFRDPNSPDYKSWRIFRGLQPAEKERVLRVIEAMIRQSA